MSFHPALTLTTSDPLDTPARAEPEGLRALRREYESKLRRAHETILSLDNLLAPQDWLDGGDGFGARGWRLNRPAQRTQDRTHGPLSYLSEEEWRQHVALARDLCTRNHLALGFRDHVSNFIGPVQISFVLRGANPGATSSGPRDADGDGEPDVDPLVAACTRAWEEWCALAEWGQGEDDREEECRRRLLVEGEATVRFFVGDEDSGGLPYVRHVEPELIRTPPGASTVDPEGWGVVTAPGDDEREEGLWVCRAENTSEGRLIGSGEYVRVKGNVDRTVKRGLSDFFPVGEPLRKVLGLLDNMAHVARLQAAIAWWEQYPTATLDQVATQVRLGADYQRVKVPPTSAGATTDVTSYEAGTVVRTEGGREVRPGPVSAPNGFEAVERMVLRSVGFRWGCPSYFSGDGDSSFASVLVTGSPFVRITEARQERAKAFGCRVASRVLEFCERSGRLPWGASRRVRAVGVCRPVVIADEEKKARTFLSLYAQNCADPVAFVRSTGADPKVVAANIRAWKKKFEPPAQPGAGPGAGGVPGGGPGPVPAPPGSAGGDGSSPNANPVGEGLWLGESLWVHESADIDSHGNPMPTTPPGEGKKWELRPYHHNGRTTQAWRRVRTDDGSVEGGENEPSSHFDAEEVGRQLVVGNFVPGEEELQNIRRDGIPKDGEHKDKIEKKWEEVIARVLGHGWAVSKPSNAAADVTGQLNIGGTRCRIVLDGKFSVSENAQYDQRPDSVQNKLKDSAKHGENTVVAYVVAYHTPEGGNGGVAEDGVLLRIGSMPQVINVADSVVDQKRTFGPFRLLNKEEYAALREGKPEAVRALRDRLIEKLSSLDLKQYQDQERADDLVQTDKTVDKASSMAAACEAHGVAPDTIANSTAAVMDHAGAAVRVAHSGATVARMVSSKDPTVNAAAPAAALAAVGALPVAEQAAVVSGGLKQLSDEGKAAVVSGGLKQLSDEGKAAVVSGGLKQLSDEGKAAVAQAALSALSDEALKQLPPAVADWVRAQRQSPPPG